MKKTILVKSFLVTLICCSGNLLAADKPLSEFSSISVEQVPSDVKDQLLKTSGEKSLNKIETKFSNGIKIYRTSWIQNGKEYRAYVTEQGAVKTEEMITKEDLPTPVLNQLKELWPTLTNANFKKTTWIIFQANPKGSRARDYFRATATGRTFSVETTLDKNGQPIRRSDIAINLVPQEAMGALKKYAGKNTIESAFTSKQGEMTVYGARWTKQGVELSAVVTESGDVVKMEMSMRPDQVPDNIQNMAKNLFPNQELEYEVEMPVVYDIIPENLKKGERVHFRLTPTGRKVDIQNSSEQFQSLTEFSNNSR